MTPPLTELRTERLHLRGWRDADRDHFAALNADPVVMEHFPAALTRAESDAFVDRIVAGLEERGWGLWAVEILESGRFAGFVGLSPVSFEAPFTPATEIGWRLDRPFWNQGLATEGARSVAAFAFEELGLAEIVSFTSIGNLASQRVMQKLGMHRDPAEDFDHPRLAGGHRLRHHVLYRLAADVAACRSPEPENPSSPSAPRSGVAFEVPDLCGQFPRTRPVP